MATTGALDVNLDAISNVINNTTGFASGVNQEIANNGDIIGLGIAIALGLTLIFGAVFVVLNFLPALIRRFKGLKSS